MNDYDTRPPPIDDRSQHGESVRWSAVGLGVAIDWIATLVTSTLIAATALAIAESRSNSPDSGQEYLRQLQASPDFVLSFLLVGLLCVSVGAFIAARRAGHSEIKHGALVGVGSVVLGLTVETLQGTKPDPEIWNPAWLQAVGYSLVIPFGMLGGMFAERTRPDREQLPR